MKILLIDSQLINCSFEDVLKQFNDTVKHKSIQFIDYNPNLGLGVDDIEQELRMVIYDSYNNYNNTDIHFSTYLYHSIENHLINILRRYQTDKREGLAYEDSLDREVFDDSNKTVLEQQQSIKDTETAFFAKYVLDVAFSIANTGLEKDVIRHFLGYVTVQQIASNHNVSRRTVYNYINDIRDELRKLL